MTYTIAAIDADILQYECAFAAEAAWKYEHAERGEEVEGPPPFANVALIVDKRIEEILNVTGVRKAKFFFTGASNFRHNIAFTHPYKDRDSRKPHYHEAVKAYIERKYETHEVDGLEADDLLGILMTAFPGKYICCSRDKDLRQIPGWHFGWEMGKQPQFGPELVDEIGYLEMKETGKSKKLIGTGFKFFFSQMITGDSVDTIPGIPGAGGVTAFQLLEPCKTYEECLEVVKRAYQEAYQLYWPEVMLEQGRLLWMVRELDSDKKPVMWSFE